VIARFLLCTPWVSSLILSLNSWYVSRCVTSIRQSRITSPNCIPESNRGHKATASHLYPLSSIDDKPCQIRRNSASHSAHRASCHTGAKRGLDVHNQMRLFRQDPRLQVNESRDAYSGHRRLRQSRSMLFDNDPRLPRCLMAFASIESTRGRSHVQCVKHTTPPKVATGLTSHTGARFRLFRPPLGSLRNPLLPHSDQDQGMMLRETHSL